VLFVCLFRFHCCPYYPASALETGRVLLPSVLIVRVVFDLDFAHDDKSSIFSVAIITFLTGGINYEGFGIPSLRFIII
jgi:uncharacterized membrane protein